jgi:hypothetical protein
MTVVSEYAEQREFDRLHLMIDATAVINGEEQACNLLNICAGGAKVQLTAMPADASFNKGDEVSLHVPKFDEFDGVIVWTDEEYFGIRFDENHKTIAALVTASA